MLKTKKDLSLGQLLTMGGALFSMHFGASCMLYPVNWGKDSGTSVFIAYIAIVLTALLLPLLPLLPQLLLRPWQLLLLRAVHYRQNHNML